MSKSETRDEGFTLVELMVVVLIIGILIAIAIPVYSGIRARAQDTAAKTLLRNALVAEKTVYTDANAYSSTTADLTAAEPSITWSTTAGQVGTVYVGVSTPVASKVALVTTSASGKCFGIQDDATAAVASPRQSSATATACTNANISGGALTGLTGSTW